MFFRKIENFLDNDEVTQIKQTVHSMKDDWRHISTFPIADEASIHRKNIDMSLIKSAENQYFLGDALYVIDNLEQIDRDIQKRLKDNLPNLYVKLLTALSHHYTNPTYSEQFAVPGFHIFNGEQTAFPFQWHIDTTLKMFDPSVNEHNIHSFLCCIETPKDPAGLEYKDTKYWERLDSVQSEYIEYDVGALYIWDGSYIHRMKQFDMQANESRITIQGHIHFTNNFSMVYW